MFGQRQSDGETRDVALDPERELDAVAGEAADSLVPEGTLSRGNRGAEARRAPDLPDCRHEDPSERVRVESERYLPRPRYDVARIRLRRPGSPAPRNEEPEPAVPSSRT